eukprot:g673.t1
MFILRNKLPQFAYPKPATQVTLWTDANRDINGVRTLPEAFSQESEITRFLTSYGNRSSTIDRLQYVESINRQSKTWTEKDKIHRYLSPEPMPRKQDSGKNGIQLTSTSDYWNEAARLQQKTGLHQNKKEWDSSLSDISQMPDTIPLDVLFTICSEKHCWLSVQDKKFLHSSDVCSGDKAVKFVAGCYLTYLGDTNSDRSSVSSQVSSEAHWKVNNKAFVDPQHPDSQLSQIMYSIGMDTNQITNYGGPAHKRYAQYFLSMLYASDPPPKQATALRIDKVTVSGLEQIRCNLRINRVLSKKWRDSILNPVLVIYQKGKLKWKNIDSILEFSPKVDVVGDCVVGIWFVKDCVSTNDPPVVAFSFHSGFMESGVVRLSSADLSILGNEIEGILDDAPNTISMELTLSQSQQSMEKVENWTPDGNCNSVHKQWIQEKRGLPEIFATMTQSQSKQTSVTNTTASKKQQNKDNVLQERTEMKSMGSKQPQSSNPSRLCVKKAPPPPPLKRKAETGRRSSSSASMTKTKPVSKTKPLFWSITPKQSGTVWSELAPETDVDESRLTLLEDLFCKDDGMKQKLQDLDQLNQQKIAPQKKGTAIAVSIGRANNVSIMMTRFKRFSNRMDDLCKAILIGEGVSPEELVLLSQIGPTEVETRELKGHDRESLSIPEQVLLAMTVVPRLRVKASCQLTMEYWNVHYSEAIDMLQTVKSACQQVRASQCLRKVFTAVLSVGNTMNKGTTRGNAGGIKIESLAKLRDTKVSRNANTKDNRVNTKVSRVGSVPTVISQCLEEKEVENKISSLLDFIAVLVHDSDQKKGVVHCGGSSGDYLLKELESLAEAVAYLEDGIGDLLCEVDKGFSLLEREFQDMTGQNWGSVDCTIPNSIHELKIKNCDVFLEDQYMFLKSCYDFLIKAGGARTFLKQEVNVSEQYLKSTVHWLGEDNGGNPKLHLRQLLEFAQQFDQSYKKLKS